MARDVILGLQGGCLYPAATHFAKKSRNSGSENHSLEIYIIWYEKVPAQIVGLLVHQAVETRDRYPSRPIKSKTTLDSIQGGTKGQAGKAGKAGQARITNIIIYIKIVHNRLMINASTVALLQT